MKLSEQYKCTRKGEKIALCSKHFKKEKKNNNSKLRRGSEDEVGHA